MLCGLARDVITHYFGIICWLRCMATLLGSAVTPLHYVVVTITGVYALHVSMGQLSLMHQHMLMFVSQPPAGVCCWH